MMNNVDIAVVVWNTIQVDFTNFGNIVFFILFVASVFVLFVPF